MNDLQKMLQEVTTISKEIGKVLPLTADMVFYDALARLDIDYADSEQLLLLDELSDILFSLEDAKRRIDYLNRPIKETSQLHKGKGGRYETAGGYWSASGDRIELLVSNGNREVPYWTVTNVLHDGKDYCFDRFEEIPMEGLTVRIREF